MTAFEACHAVTKRWEKGYANHPRDPGGATLNGVTQRVYDNYRRLAGQAPRPVKQMTPDEEMKIYVRGYWDAIKGDNLPPGIDLVVYDMAVNSGPGRAIRYLQAALGVKQDGQMGPVTLAAALEAYRVDDDAKVIQRYMAARERFLRSLDTFDVFGKGWMNRVRDVSQKAKRMEVIEDEARAFKVRAKGKEPANSAPVTGGLYQPDKAQPPEDAVNKASFWSKVTGWLGGAGAIGAAAQAAIATVKETLNGIVPEGSVWLPVIALTVAGGTGFLAWQSWRNGEVPEKGNPVEAVDAEPV